MKIKKILFTGSLGFIFSNFIRKAAYEKAPYKICGIDKAANKKYLNNIYNNKIIENNYLADISDEHIIENIFNLEKPEIVIHGASSTVDNSYKECINTNILGTKILIDACERHGIEKIIYLSGDRVYSPLDYNSKSSLKEEDALSGRSMHSISQVAAESMITSSKLNYNILRMCQIYGPRQSDDNLIPYLIKNIKLEKEIVLNYSGMELMDWMHVFDFSSALINILKSEKDREIYNISTGYESSPLEISQLVCNYLNDGHNLIKFKSGEANFKYSLDNRKILDLDWKPMFKIKKGIEDTVEWFQTNQWSLR
jgi:dTDP-glucose 4,6-dehydratase